jgi:hypothetical protein
MSYILDGMRMGPSLIHSGVYTKLAVIDTEYASHVETERE